MNGYEELALIMRLGAAFISGQDEVPPPPPPVVVVVDDYGVSDIDEPFEVPISLVGDDNGDGRINEDESGWDCRTTGNQRCGTGYVDKHGFRHYVDFSGDVPVVSWSTSEPDTVSALPVDDYPPDNTRFSTPDQLASPPEIVETIETGTGHRDVDANGNVRNESESDRDAAIEAITDRTTVTVENGMCVWWNDAGAVVSVSTSVDDCS